MTTALGLLAGVSRHHSIRFSGNRKARHGLATWAISAKSAPGKKAGYSSTRIATIPVDPRRLAPRASTSPILRAGRLISRVPVLPNVCYLTFSLSAFAYHPQLLRHKRLVSWSNHAVHQKHQPGSIPEPSRAADAVPESNDWHDAPKAYGDSRRSYEKDTARTRN
jgi:hypothetical protein